MILRRPYGLMIKHFKLIHFILLVLSGLVIWQLRDLLQFFNSFIANGYITTVTENMASNYISIAIYLTLLLVMVVLIMLIVLLKFKKKPANIYIIALVYYIILLLGIIIAASLLNGLEEQLWTTTAARLYRDIATMLSVPAYIFIPFWLIRALGFNIKQFNFQSDIQELNILDADSEEIEINIGFETYKTRRKIHRIGREFKYYYSENKFIMTSIIVITSAVLIYLFFSNFEILVKRYKVGDSFKFNDLDITIDDSIITNLNYSGNVINDKDYFYLLKLTIKNNTHNDQNFEYNKFLLYTSKNDYYISDLGLSSDFVDYAEAFNNLPIEPGYEKTIFLPYAINKDKINTKYHLSIYNGISKKKKEYKVKTIEIPLNPVVVDKISEVAKVSLNEELDFSSTYLNNTSITIKDAKVTSEYVYDYIMCNLSICNTYKGKITPKVENIRQTLLVLDYDFKLDMEAPYSKVSDRASTFATNFFKVRYVTNEATYTSIVKNVTPATLADKIVLQVPKDVENANEIDLLVTIRNKSYIINLIGG